MTIDDIRVQTEKTVEIEEKRPFSAIFYAY